MGGGVSKGPQYHNPDPIARLIGPTNEAEVILEGICIPALVDTGANMMCINQWLANALKLPVKPLQTFLDIEGTGEGKVPYYGYVEGRLEIPSLPEFGEDILMLVIDDSPYGKRVPIQLGTIHIDMVLRALKGDESPGVSEGWKRAQLAATLNLGQAQTAIGEGEGIDLNDLVGSVTTTQRVKLAPFEGQAISGVMKGPIRGVGISKRVNVLSEPSTEQLKEGAKFSTVPAYTYASPGSARVQVMIKNLTARAVTIGKGQVVAELKPANAVPKMLAPKVVEEAAENALGGGDRGTSSEGSPREPSCEGRENVLNDKAPRAKLTESQMAELYEKLELEKHTEGWNEQLRKELREIMDEYGFLFALDSLDLGKTDVVKHHIELSDYTPIKDRYRRIPPHQYDEVRKHLQEMLAVGAIRKSNSPWTSPVVLVRKKDGSLRFCIDL